MTAPTTERVPTERVRELLALTPGPFGGTLVETSMVRDLAADLLDARQERDALADALRTERAAREAAERAIALLSRTLGCESDTPEGIVTEALDYAAEQRERAEAADDAVARAADRLAAVRRGYAQMRRLYAELGISVADEDAMGSPRRAFAGLAGILRGQGLRRRGRARADAEAIAEALGDLALLSDGMTWAEVRS